MGGDGVSEKSLITAYRKFYRYECGIKGNKAKRMAVALANRSKDFADLETTVSTSIPVLSSAILDDMDNFNALTKHVNKLLSEAFGVEILRIFEADLNGSPSGEVVGLMSGIDK
jgi:hypothetical protein